jgi:uncharacterized YigZ family protein
LYFVDKCYDATLERKKSKFITYICPYDDFKVLLDDLKSSHKKARHFVYAYRYLNHYDQIVENSSDDGEPKGTSGKPSLKVLQGNDIINTAVIIVRYFGGIKLGTGGLTKAYSDAVNQALSVSNQILYQKLITQKIEVSYSELSKKEYELKQKNIKIISKEFGEKVILTVASALVDR